MKLGHRKQTDGINPVETRDTGSVGKHNLEYF